MPPTLCRQALDVDSFGCQETEAGVDVLDLDGQTDGQAVRQAGRRSKTRLACFIRFAFLHFACLSFLLQDGWQQEKKSLDLSLFVTIQAGGRWIPAKYSGQVQAKLATLAEILFLVHNVPPQPLPPITFHRSRIPT